VTPTARRAAIGRVAAVAYHAGLTGLACRVAGRGPRRVPLLTYHRVNDERDPYFPSLPTAVFERQMAYVARAYRVLPLDELVDRLGRGDLPANALAITFDDGFRDNLTHAAPILARHRLPATVFLATGFIGTAAVPWFDRIAAAFKTTVAPSFTAPWGAAVPLGSVGERLAAVARSQAYLKTVPHPAFDEQVDRICAAVGGHAGELAKNEMLGWDDVHALRGLGWAIGAHTVSHPILSRMGAEQAAREIGGSRQMIQASCGLGPRAFAYPNGQPEDYTETTVRLVREAGFDCAVTTRFGMNGPATPSFELRRGGPSEHHLPTFALKLAWYRLTMGTR
jgi:peptidoglycan/xylan/chitin deacetylase (PgdA/CDA1 family)